MAQTDFPCLILCGGLSRRFEEGHKAQALLNGKPVLQHVIDRIMPQTGDINLNAPTNVGYEAYNFPLRPDEPGESKGPLVGILAAMEWAGQNGHARVLTCSNDTPFIPEDWAQKLAKGSPDKIAVPIYAEKTHFVCALWPTNLRGALSDYLDNGGRAVKGFVQSQHVENIEYFSENNVDPFFNINRADELKTAERILKTLNRQ